MISHLQIKFEEILCLPLVSVQIVSHDLGCRTVIFRTSFHTWQHLIPTSPLHDHSHYLPTPTTEIKANCNTRTTLGMIISVYSMHLYMNVFSSIPCNQVHYVPWSSPKQWTVLVHRSTATFIQYYVYHDTVCLYDIIWSQKYKAYIIC